MDGENLSMKYERAQNITTKFGHNINIYLVTSRNFNHTNLVELHEVPICVPDIVLVKPLVYSLSWLVVLALIRVLHIGSYID